MGVTEHTVEQPSNLCILMPWRHTPWIAPLCCPPPPAAPPAGPCGLGPCSAAPAAGAPATCWCLVAGAAVGAAGRASGAQTCSSGQGNTLHLTHMTQMMVSLQITCIPCDKCSEETDRTSACQDWPWPQHRASQHSSAAPGQPGPAPASSPVSLQVPHAEVVDLWQVA